MAAFSIAMSRAPAGDASVQSHAYVAWSSKKLRFICFSAGARFRGMSTPPKSIQAMSATTRGATRSAMLITGNPASVITGSLKAWLPAWPKATTASGARISTKTTHSSSTHSSRFV